MMMGSQLDLYKKILVLYTVEVTGIDNFSVNTSKFIVHGNCYSIKRYLFVLAETLQKKSKL